MTSIALAGAAGRMGTSIIRSALRLKDISIVSALEAAGTPAIGRDAGETAGTAAMRVIISSDTKELLKGNVIVNFSIHGAIPSHAEVAAAGGRPMVLGTTGLSESETEAVRKASVTIPIVWAPNMSLGVNLLFSMVQKAAAILNPGYRIVVEETHHIHKKDAPSGTAIRLGEKVAEGLGKKYRDIAVHNPASEDKEHANGKIVVLSHREGEVVGDHTVSFESECERIEFTHHAWSRDALAMGALHAAKWIVGRKPGLYDMQDVLGLR